MAFQIVFVLESNKESKTDYIYIRSVLSKWYNLHLLHNTKITSIYMNGKGNYNKRKVSNEIKRTVNEYKRNGKTYVIYCFDTDKYDSDPYDKKILQEEMDYCDAYGYEFVWFCHDVEEVFVGESIVNSEKNKRARQYSKKNEVQYIEESNLRSEKIERNKSNLMIVLDKVFSLNNE